jgi:hypothetical protein
MKRYIGERTPDHCTVTIIDDEGGKEPLNPRHDLRNHSPDGLNFGALLADALGDDDRAQQFYQDYKFRIIARLNGDRFELTDEQIRQSVAELEAARGRRYE